MIRRTKFNPDSLDDLPGLLDWRHSAARKVPLKSSKFVRPSATADTHRADVATVSRRRPAPLHKDPYLHKSPAHPSTFCTPQGKVFPTATSCSSIITPLYSGICPSNAQTKASKVCQIQSKMILFSSLRRSKSLTANLLSCLEPLNFEHQPWSCHTFPDALAASPHLERQRWGQEYEPGPGGRCKLPFTGDGSCVTERRNKTCPRGHRATSHLCCASTHE